MTLLGCMLLAFAAVMAVAVLSPVRLRFTTIGGVRVAVSWFGLTVTVIGGQRIVSILGWQVSSTPIGAVREKGARPKKPGLKKPVRTLSQRIESARQNRPVLLKITRVALRLAGRLLRAWRLERGRIAMAVGTGDPATTGMAIGYLYAARGMILRRWPQLEWELRGTFDRATFHGEADLVWRVIPLTPLIHVARAVATLPWRGIWRMRRTRTA